MLNSYQDNHLIGKGVYRCPHNDYLIKKRSLDIKYIKDGIQDGFQIRTFAIIVVHFDT